LGRNKKKTKYRLALRTRRKKMREHKGLGKQKDFAALRISIASPDHIKDWSYGEVTKPETINYRTFKAEKDGLFDERIFGPTKDYECYCGKYKKARFKGIICDKCGVEVTSKRVRRERMGHISLAAPVAHVWFFRGVPSIISILLGVSPRNLEGVIYLTHYLVVSFDKDKKKEGLERFSRDLKKQIAELKKSGEEKETLAVKVGILEERLAQGTELLKSVKKFTILTELEYELIAPYLKGFAEVGIGAEAIRRALSEIDLGKISANLRKKIKNAKGERGIRFSRRLRIVENLRAADISPSWMILATLPVIPPDLRPMVQLEGGRFATSDLNDLYRAVINRNNRLKRLLELGAPEIIIRNEKRMLQEAVDALIDSSKTRKRRMTRGGKQLRSFADMLSGKQGRFRQNLLGKRVDYSGRSVIVVGPNLRLSEVGLPREMALELFKPFVLREILLDGLAPNLRSAKTYLEEKTDDVWDILEKIVENHPVLLNRAPSLHRLSVLGFYPKLIGGSAIQLHPAVCAGFNADFDGDAMAVHVPLSSQALEEVKTLMLSTKNLLRPATGKPIAYPTKEQVMGLYHLTSIAEGEKSRKEEELKVFSSEDESLLAHGLGHIVLREKIRVLVGKSIVITTVGRVILNQRLPKILRFFNDDIDASVVKEMIARTLTEKGENETVDLIDALKDLGFEYASDSNISLAVFDATVPEEKPKILDEAESKAREIERNFRRGLITNSERRELSRAVWSEATSKLAELAWKRLPEENPIKFMISSGAAGATKEQVKQISGMRGHIVDPTGRIVEMPIVSNYQEGLTGFEYFAGARGARKGLVDTALRTADAGYLTRRLVDVAQDVIVREKDCGTSLGISKYRSDESLLTTFGESLIGRVAAENLKEGRKTLAKKGSVIKKEQADLIDKSKVEEVVVRSPLTCESLYGICASCYGLDLGHNQMVETGTPVGIIAAQSIGEPGTQLTLRTFHTGGIVGRDITQGLPRVEEIFEARTPKFEAVVAETDGKVNVLEEGELKVIKLAGKDKTEVYEIPATRTITVSDGEVVKKGQPLTEGHLDPKKLVILAGIQETQKYLVSESQNVYASQGVSLNDIHLEVITRQMFNKVRVKNPGGTTFISGEIVTRARLNEENGKLPKGVGKAKAVPEILGITKSSLKTDSFLAAASFQDTTRVLTEAAASGSVDKLLGLKENVIIGRLIPTGERAKLEEE
jgi:DNA-directed RNA polymerase subunit beta'